ncbi:MAG: selenocysteine-specific translation elongation factor [Planctomycetes bacterium B3_Pla]|nr:MAG: selenocysteine-specific translation elongation factor [Planctomycetes bacterium B3_Pla]
MDAAQKNITLGTAGHIDHGKTALIKCLTGCDTDLLKAEKERGMSIDLGFAPCTVSDLEVGIVDVPGHENFIKTMVAGATGIDGVIFVIAADDGVMPQTREHLDILTLLGVGHGIVALTKVDCVEAARTEKVTAEVEDFLVGTFLENAPILPVSSITGKGFDTFYEALKELVDAIEPKKTDGVFRLPVERTFSVKGYGTVVTGIPVAGTVKVGDEVVLFPHGTKGRVKAVQVYKRNSDTAMVGQCAALNVPQWDHKNIERGNTVTLAKYFSPEQWYLCRLRVLASVKTPLKTGANVKFHTGTSEVLATVYLLEANRVVGGDDCLIQVRLDRPQRIVAAPGDRFIVRSLSPVQTIGGGTIVEALPARLKRNQPQVLRDAEDRARAVLVERDFVEYCIKTAEAFAVNEGELSVRAKMLPGPLKDILTKLTGDGKVVNLDSKLFIHCDTARDVQQKLIDIVGDFHRSKPESPGLGVEQLYDTSRVRKDVFDGIVKLLTSQGKLVERKHRLALPEHRELFSDDEQELLRSVESLFKTRPFNPPKIEEVAESTKAGAEEIQKVLRILIEQEHLVRVENGLLFHSEAVEQAREILTSYIKKEGGLESVKFKYLLNTTRKFAIPLLDYFDRIGVTRRAGYTRHLRTGG